MAEVDPDANAWQFTNAEVVDLRLAPIVYGQEDRLIEVASNALTAFYARMGREPKAFLIDDVKAGILDKLAKDGTIDRPSRLEFGYHLDKGRAPTGLFGIPIWVAR